MARTSHPPQINLSFRDFARELLDFRVRAGPGNFLRQRLDFFGQYWIGIDW
jgi:hypothetical protein